MKRITSSIALALLALALTACSVTVTVPFPPDSEPVSVTAPSPTPTPVTSRSVSAGAEAWYEVTVSSTRASQGDVIYLEVDAGRDETQDATDILQVRVYRPNNTVVATSEGPDGFADGNVAPTAAGLGIQAITPTYTCLGACVLLPSASGTYYVRVRNMTSSSVSFDFYAYMKDFQDPGEPGNDTPSGAVVLSGFDTGAIETIDDEDYYDVVSTGTLRFDSQSLLDLRAEVSFNGRVLTTLSPGGSYGVENGDLVRVYALDGQAGASSASNYSLEIQ